LPLGLETLDANGKELAYDENAYPRGMMPMPSLDQYETL
jgi:hypothetical protein